MRSIAAWPAPLIAICLTSLGCGGGNEFTPDDPDECVPVTVDVADACTSFCATAVEECDAFVFDEASCQQGCETNLREAYGCSEDCGTALEAMFQCVAERDDCQDVYDWRDRTDDHACLSAVDDVGVVCPF